MDKTISTTSTYSLHAQIYIYLYKWGKKYEDQFVMSFYYKRDVNLKFLLPFELLIHILLKLLEFLIICIKNYIILS